MRWFGRCFASDISCWFEQRAATPLSRARAIFLISQEASGTAIIHKSVEQGVGDALTFDWRERAAGRSEVAGGLQRSTQVRCAGVQEGDRAGAVRGVRIQRWA
jgi:hypothetical protein